MNDVNIIAPRSMSRQWPTVRRYSLSARLCLYGTALYTHSLHVATTHLDRSCVCRFVTKPRGHALGEHMHPLECACTPMHTHSPNGISFVHAPVNAVAARGPTRRAAATPSRAVRRGPPAWTHTLQDIRAGVSQRRVCRKRWTRRTARPLHALVVVVVVVAT
jgi:hypothetical protein